MVSELEMLLGNDDSRKKNNGYHSVECDLNKDKSSLLFVEEGDCPSHHRGPPAVGLMVFLSLTTVAVLCALEYVTLQEPSQEHQPHSLELLENRFNNWEEWKHKFHDTEEKIQDWFHNETAWIRNKTHQQEQDDINKDDVLYFNTSHAFELLLDNSKSIPSTNLDYFQVTPGWDAQVNQAFCAVASSVAVLNSFRGTSLDLPVDKLYDPYHYATQNDVWNECTHEKVVHRNATVDGVLQVPGGLGMAQTKQLLECNLDDDNSWTVTQYPVDPSKTSLRDMKRDIKAALESTNSRVIVNYHRALANQVGGGHWSPVVGYSSVRDAFLLLDVAKYKYPPAWIPSKLLYKSLASMDPCGVWDFPRAHQDVAFDPTSQEEFAAAMKQLNCQSTYRGYIVVEQHDSPKKASDVAAED